MFSGNTLIGRNLNSLRRDVFLLNIMLLYWLILGYLVTKLLFGKENNVGVKSFVDNIVMIF